MEHSDTGCSVRSACHVLHKYKILGCMFIANKLKTALTKTNVNISIHETKRDELGVEITSTHS